MKINKNNYEAYFLDYWENNLDEQGRRELAIFLEQHTGLQDEFFAFRDAVDERLSLDPNVTFPGKKAIKKTEVRSFGKINQDNYEHFIIAKLEGDLSQEEQKDFSRFLEVNPQIKPELETYGKTILRADNAIRFPDNKQLKKGRVIAMNFRGVFRYAAAAAVLLLLAGAYYFFGLNSVDQPAEMLVNNELVGQYEHTDVSSALSDQKQAVQFSRPVTEKISPIRPDDEISTSDPGSAKENPAYKSDFSGDQVFGYGAAFAVQQIPARDQLQAIDNKRIKPETVYTYRVEVSAAFDDMLLRDLLAYETGEKKSRQKSAFARVFANLFNRALGLDPETGEPENQSLLAGLTIEGREAIAEMSGRFPVFSKEVENGRREVSIGLNENFKIRRTTTREKKALPEK